MEPVKEKIKKAFDSLKEKHNYQNRMEAPRILKVIVSTGVGSFKDKKRVEFVENKLTKITGQKPAQRGAKKSIAAFKVREGDTVGLQVTLRGARMYDFLDKLINIALPRTKDFRGVPDKSIDEMSNYTLGIKENVIFPETSDEDIRDVFGLAVTIVTNCKSREETRDFLEHIGVPFKKQEVAKKS